MKYFSKKDQFDDFKSFLKNIDFKDDYNKLYRVTSIKHRFCIFTNGFPDTEDITPLMYASIMGYRSVVRYILKIKNIDVNISNPQGLTALIIAVKQRNYIITSMLIRAKANMTYRDITGKHSIDYAHDTKYLLFYDYMIFKYNDRRKMSTIKTVLLILFLGAFMDFTYTCMNPIFWVTLILIQIPMLLAHIYKLMDRYSCKATLNNYKSIN